MEYNNTNLSMKEFIIRDIAKNRNVVNDKILPENVINAVITHQFEGIVKAFIDNNSVEVSGFGTFHFSQQKALNKMRIFDITLQKNMKMLEDENISDNERRKVQMRITSLLSQIKTLKPKLNNNEHTTDI